MLRSGSIRRQPDDLRAEPVRRSLRRRWNRAFAGLLVVLLLGSLVSAGVTAQLVSGSRRTGETIEHEASYLAQLRADMVAEVVASAINPRTAGQQRVLVLLGDTIREHFRDGISAFGATKSSQLLRRSFGLWTA